MHFSRLGRFAQSENFKRRFPALVFVFHVFERGVKERGARAVAKEVGKQNQCTPLFFFPSPRDAKESEEHTNAPFVSHSLTLSLSLSLSARCVFARDPLSRLAAAAAAAAAARARVRFFFSSFSSKSFLPESQASARAKEFCTQKASCLGCRSKFPYSVRCFFQVP